MIWTNCDKNTQSYQAGHFNAQGGYATHIWDPAIPASVEFSSPVVHTIQNGNGSASMPDDDGIFCGGHVWMLDELGEPKLLSVGGTDRGQFNACHTLVPALRCGHNGAVWFDPRVEQLTGTSTPEDDAWVAGVPDLSGTVPGYEGVWYPSVILVYDGIRFVPVVIGGGGTARTLDVLGGCGQNGTSGIYWQYEKVWALTPDPGTGSFLTGGAGWTTHSTPGYAWHQYPRAFLIDDGADGAVVNAGHVIVCEDPILGSTHEYGGNPVSWIDVDGSTQALSWMAGTDPNPAMAPRTVGGWQYNSAVIMHTLKASGDHHMNRILAVGGAPEYYSTDLAIYPDAAGTEVMGNNELYELDPLDPTGGPQGTWYPKAQPGTKRVFANFTLLPDGRVLLVGGQKHGRPGHDTVDLTDPLYLSTPQLFDPGPAPFSPGTWIDTAPRKTVGFQPGYGPYAVPRSYHSVAILLQDGRVAVMGGDNHPELGKWDAVDPSDTVEIYSPPYCFESSRLKIKNVQPGGMHYGQSFCIEVDDASRVAYACLIGIGSVTHHFDYGQRYVELTVTTGAQSGCSTPYNVAVTAPTKLMAPEGFYLLFVGEDRQGTSVPCIKGRFVKLTF